MVVGGVLGFKALGWMEAPGSADVLPATVIVGPSRCRVRRSCQAEVGAMTVLLAVQRRDEPQKQQSPVL